MIKKIYFYNVGNGDCFLCTNEDKDKTDYNSLLVDCGNKAFYKPDSLIIDKLNCSKSIDLLISHIHSDHYSKLGTINSNANKAFDKIYLPNYIANCGVMLCGLALNKLKSTAFYNLAKSMLLVMGFSNYINIYDPNKTKIMLVTQGVTDSNNTSKLQFLAPILDNSLNKILEEICDDYTYRKLSSFEEKYLKIINLEKENDSKGENKTEQEIKLNNEFENVLESYIEEIESEDLKINVSNSELIDVFKAYHNKLSIVFHENEKIDNNVLFCGDTEKEIIADIKNKNLFNKHYKVIKIPHHGTISHFSDDLPESEYFLIPGGNKKSPSEWISCKYNLKYRTSTYTTNFICANNDGCFMKNCCNQCNIKSEDICGIDRVYEINI